MIPGPPSWRDLKKRSVPESRMKEIHQTRLGAKAEMNEMYQQCSEELLTFFNHGQEYEKTNSKVVRRSVS